jgi:large subunit ribosomal protein L13
MKLQKTYTPRAADIERSWWVVDATDLPLGRLASEVAKILRGKHKPTFAPHMDGGDYVVVVNAEKVAVTGGKASQKTYYRHSGYPGGLSESGFEEVRAKHPERIVERAVRGMLPKNRLGRAIYRKLKVYAGPDHPHTGQEPQVLDIDVRKVQSA